MKTIFVSGATGALGRVVTARLRREGEYRVVAAGRRGGAECDLEVDLCDRDGLASSLSRTKPDVVLHLAATYASDFDKSYALNVQASQFLLDTVQQLRPNARVLLAGSAAEYGIVRPEENPVREDRVLAPVSIYGLTKTWQTQLAGLYASRGVDVVVARIFNLDGPNLSERLFVGRVQKQIEETQAGRRLMIEVGPLSAVRDYISTDDAADQILAIAAHGHRGRIYHVASGVPVTMRAILDRYLSCHGLNWSIVRESADLSNHIGYDVPVIYADVTSTKELMRAQEASVEA